MLGLVKSLWLPCREYFHLLHLEVAAGRAICAQFVPHVCSFIWPRCWQRHNFHLLKDAIPLVVAGVWDWIPSCPLRRTQRNCGINFLGRVRKEYLQKSPYYRHHLFVTTRKKKVNGFSWNFLQGKPKLCRNIRNLVKTWQWETFDLKISRHFCVHFERNSQLVCKKRV